ncbi:MAG: helix-turn-helix domain-containing protein [Bacteroidota bacterium]
MKRRTYHQFCGLAKALDLVGERWTLLIVRNLLLGPLRYSDLQHGLPGITTNLLAKRLKEMEAHGLIERVRRTPTARSFAYRLSERGAALEPAIHALGGWGMTEMHTVEAGDERRLEWLLVSLKRRYLGGMTLTAELVADAVPYAFQLTPDAISIQRGAAPSPQLRLAGPALMLGPMLLGAHTANTLPASITVDDSGDHLEQFLGAFRYPERLPVLAADDASAAEEGEEVRAE